MVPIIGSRGRVEDVGDNDTDDHEAPFKTNPKHQNHDSYINETLKPVITESPDNSAAFIPDVEKDSNYGKVLIFFDKSKTKCLGVVLHQAVS